jgi:glyoxylase-like metal-dependent hydrolase (beta-lactamase superfamily II)
VSTRTDIVVDRYGLGPIGTNCYVVRASRDAPEAVVVDPGGEAAELRLELARAGASCAAILITHGHWDHLGGVAGLAEGTGARGYTADTFLRGDETFELAGVTFETLQVPGHSPAHLAFHAAECLFSGDVLFAGSVGRTDLPGADWETLVESIRMLGERFPPETIVYPGHGPPTTLGVELERNPFLAPLRAS